MADAREARRQRILNRGADRMAFITGQTRSLPLDSSTPPPSPTPTPKAAPSPTAATTKMKPPPPTAEEEFPRVSPVVPSPGDGTSGFRVNNFDIRSLDVNNTSVDNSREASSGVSEIRGSSGILKHERENDIKLYEKEKKAEIKNNQTEPASNIVGNSVAQRSYNRVVDAGKSTVPDKVQSRSAKSAVPDKVQAMLAKSAVPDKVQAILAKSAMPDKIQVVFSSKQITNSISATENIRLICAIVIGLLAVILRKLFKFRPLLLVILTDITVVLAKLMTSEGAGERGKESAKSRNDDLGWADNLGKTLEMSMVFQKVVSAIFMDCSICAVILICGFAF